MQLTRVSIRNFKGLREIDVPLSRFVCVIGENNAGKSSFLQALLLFAEGRKIDSSMYFDTGQPITISADLAEINESDFGAISSDDHRNRFREMVRNGSVTLVRRYDVSGASRLRWISRAPKDDRFGNDAIENFLAGKKPGPAFVEEIACTYPEIADKIDSKTNQKQARLLLAQIVALIPEEDQQNVEDDLPSGFDNTIRPLMPEPIYIPAVKNLEDEIATKDSASFGKLLGVLLDQIAPDLQAQEETFKQLNTSLNRIEQNDGSILDMRLQAVRNIETTVQSHVQENFPRVELDIRIPPPQIKTVLSSAQIWVDDGVKGLIDSKGDGLKRTVTFSILRSYVELRRQHKASNASTGVRSNYLFLFEEPELYLHPSAQGILFDALGEISKTNHVVVSTHSPLFFGTDTTGTFIKLTKTVDPIVSSKPFAEALYVDLGSLDDKSRFQLISYETNNTAFFYDTVVLVEGDSELLVLPHLARILNPEWSSERTGVAFCRIWGKGNIARYRDFFSRFGVRVCVVGDLDCLLDGFDKLGASKWTEKCRETLLRAIDLYATDHGIEGKISSREIRDIQASPSRRAEFQKLKDTLTRYREGHASIEDVNTVELDFFAELCNSKRRQVLEDCADRDLSALKHQLLTHLREQDIFILEKGAIESYYPEAIQGPDKPSKAIDFCNQVRTKEAALNLCGELPRPDGSAGGKEFTEIFSAIYGFAPENT